MSVEQLDSDDEKQFECMRRLLCPFVLTGAIESWTAFNEWPNNSSSRAWRSYLPAIFPDAIADFYPYNMLQSDHRAPSTLYYTHLRHAVRELEIQPSPQQQYSRLGNQDFACCRP